MSRFNHVLYIDDDPANLDTVSRALTRQGYMVLVAKTGQEGIELAERERPDLILLDMTGFDVCEELQLNTEIKSP